jgi:hypothetical protein
MESAVKGLVLRPVILVAHFLVAVAGSVFVGFVPEYFLSRFYYNTGIEAYSPAIAVSAFLVGYYVSFRLKNMRNAAWTWVVGILWLTFGAIRLTSSWGPSSSGMSAWAYVAANLFGPARGCGPPECFYEIIFTTPCTASVMYSVGAYLWKQRNPIVTPKECR